MPYTIRPTASDAVKELFTPEGQSIATVEAAHAQVLALAPDMRRTLERIAAMDVTNAQAAILARNEAREMLERLEE